ncbi:MAG: nucleotidyltransferase domain-containing protein [Anaerolineales bacterium]|nr:nucleotidyltransferase domain-containing protein [Anaerolineales bacterium]
MMKKILDSNTGKISELCEKYRVRRLELFGSASRDDFQQKVSDLDFLVEFFDSLPVGAFDCYFGLKEDLEQLFQFC